MLNDVPFHSNPPNAPPGISPFIGRPKRSLYQADSAFGSFAWIAVPPTYSRPIPAGDFGAGLAGAAAAAGVAGVTGHAGAGGRAQVVSTSSRMVRRWGVIRARYCYWIPERSYATLRQRRWSDRGSLPVGAATCATGPDEDDPIFQLMRNGAIAAPIRSNALRGSRGCTGAPVASSPAMQALRQR